MAQAIRYSKKREAILQAIQSTDTHPSAEWVYQKLKADHPDLSLGTVYRNLVFFQKQGTIKSVGVINGQERFDPLTTPHSHFVCTRCSAVIDLLGLTLDQNLDKDVCNIYPCQVERHELTFFGLCSRCIQKAQEEEGKEQPV